MSAPNAPFETRPFPISLRLVIDACEWGLKKHIIHALAEFDVTHARDLIKEHAAKTGQKLSFTAFIASCAGKAVGEDRSCHAYRKGRKLLLFDDVDIGMLVEHDVEGAKLATFHVIRAADKKAVGKIHEEIRTAQQERVDASPEAHRWEFYLKLPAFLRRLLYWWMDRHPETRKRLAGTVTLTAIGMAGKGAGWGIPIAMNTLTIALGGIERRPGLIEGRIEPREFLCTTVSFDHDIVDGIPAAKFVSRFRELVERAWGLT